MTPVRWHVTMSLDGFIAGPDHAMDWAFTAAGDAHSPLAEEIRDQTGAILAGRTWHDVALERYDGRQGIYGGRWDGPVLVLTHRTDAPPPDPGVRWVTGPIEEAVAAGRAAAGAGALGVFGADTARQVLAAGLLDEIIVHLAPVLLGDGVKLYDAPGAPPVRLERTQLETAGGVTGLRYRVSR